ncbi:uncharacterized protein METZ01_LOCUS288296 [marine metagenome]|uniref:peptidylprolyl isomerase n=1 Tax=marine metagenome TaxID=408172 RepID=A0A382LK43_9ZZZZ|tara:strand:- start:2987 stop:3547 length:561 start_codon:yes stop_codon:yes gene_type:complete
MTDMANTNKSEQAIETNKVVSFHYRLAEVDREGSHGEWTEQSHGGEPLYYLHGYHNVIVGLEKALEGKKVGDKIEITLSPDQAYGPRNPEGVRRIPAKHLRYSHGQKKAQPGMLAAVETNQGIRPVVVLKAGKFNLDVDFNHPFAGKILFYEVEVISIREATEEEILHGHVHGHSDPQLRSREPLK